MIGTSVSITFWLRGRRCDIMRAGVHTSKPASASDRASGSVRPGLVRRMHHCAPALVASARSIMRRPSPAGSLSTAHQAQADRSSGGKCATRLSVIALMARFQRSSSISTRSSMNSSDWLILPSLSTSNARLTIARISTRDPAPTRSAFVDKMLRDLQLRTELESICHGDLDLRAAVVRVKRDVALLAAARSPKPDLLATSSPILAASPPGLSAQRRHLPTCAANDATSSA